MSYTVGDFRSLMSGYWEGPVLDKEDGDYVDNDEIQSYVTMEESTLEVPGIGDVSLEVRWGGEGDGAAMGYVVRVDGEDGIQRFFELRGHYSSWDSDYFDGDWNEVQPYNKFVTRFKPL